MTGSDRGGLLRRSARPLPRRERGAALIFLVLLMVVGVGLFVVNASQETLRVAISDRGLAVNMQAAKDALVAYSVAQPRPGVLPCPDTNDDGLAEAMVLGQCPAYLGRLPWRTLGVGDIRDRTGERYWYALSDNFRDGVVINSDTHGNRTVHSGTATVTQTAEAAAVIFSPGGVLDGQVRDATVTLCPTTATAILNRLCATNYLETSGGVNNSAAPGTGPFMATESTETFNDRLIIVRTSDFIPLVERRVAGELRRALVLYHEASRDALTGTGCNCYPWADQDFDGDSDVGVNKGRVPLIALPHNWSPQPPAPPNVLTDGLGNPYPLPALPAYFVANNWHTVIHYTVGRQSLQNFGVAPTACTTCTADPLLPPPLLLRGSLSLDKSIGHAVMIITPGSAGPNRPAGWTGNWGDYIDDGSNRDGDDRFLTPKARLFDRDRLLTIPGQVYPESCRTNSRVLIRNAPCRSGGGVKPICNQAERNLQMCTQCSGDATKMVTDPCRKSLSSSSCQNAVAKLQTCSS